ncbi:NADH:flavin oxidoreductase [Desulfosporosinus metallidurans]|uniref:2,4-dienoyl-CoA reductase [NADPH] n=1 Tax=Desulfosporosinus metallidurans TaxID=1888891 RepID=A0A1Q8QH61_9FIRM|nr:NADH:flavin oxidoreductase [Desulfosporosinus metallidurans]OLN26676.1 2,4-dienoyl-CoA reductase [NADPH] [Desulfosporosinus metallidurans]
MSIPYPNLFSEASIGNMIVKNRLIRSATFEELADEHGNVTDGYIELHRRLASGGVGLIITGYAHPIKNGGLPHMIGVESDDCIKGLRKVVEAVHNSGDGCKIALQIGHCGRQFPRRLQKETVAPSAVIDPSTGRIPREMSFEEVDKFIKACSAAVRRARDAGFDAVQFHAAHGWLLSSFLSPHTNRRQDMYGGSTENRVRVLSEIYKHSVKQVGSDFPIFAKINGNDFVEGGIDPNESLRLGKILSEVGFAALEVSCCMWETIVRRPEEIGWQPAVLPESRTNIVTKEKEAYNRAYTQLFKEKIENCSIILVGGLRSADVMEEIVSRKDADFVSLSRPLIREPDLPYLFKSGSKSVADCISCNKCITNKKRHGLHCSNIENI